MYSVFSKYLIARHMLILQAKYRCKQKEEDFDVESALTTFNKDCPGVFTESLILANQVMREEISYKIATTSKLRNVLHWVNKNIVMKAHSDSPYTLDVRVRIATSMLNKLVEEGVISKDMNLVIHQNMVSNVSDMKWSLQVDDLPF